MHTVARRLRLSPLADIRVAKDALPYALALFQTKGPLSLINLAVGPCVHALPMWLTIEELALIAIAIGVALHSAAIFGIGLPLALVDACLAILHHTKAVSLAVGQFTAIDSLTIVFHSELGRLLEYLKVEHLALHYVLGQLRCGLPSFIVHGGVLEG